MWEPFKSTVLKIIEDILAKEYAQQQQQGQQRWVAAVSRDPTPKWTLESPRITPTWRKKKKMPPDVANL